MKKIVAGIIIILFVVSLLPVFAEEEVVNYFAVVDNTYLTIFDNEVCWLTTVYVVRTGQFLSYYDDMKLDLGTPLVIKVFNGDEIVDVEYVF